MTAPHYREPDAALFDDLDGDEPGDADLDTDALRVDTLRDLDALDESLTTARGALHGALRGLR